MKLIIGLGNIGDQYTNTRHNVGFMAIDRLSNDYGFENFKDETKLNSSIAKGVINGEQIILAKPTTFMNESGRAVQAIMHYYKVAISDVIIVHDELDLPFASLRIKNGGGSAGNNGIKSIMAQIGDNFSRYRIGVQNDMSAKVPSEKFVLQNFSSEEMGKLPTILSRVIEILSENLKDSEPSQVTFDLLKTAPITTYSGGGVIVNSAGEVAVTQQANNAWSLPKGHIEAGEDARAAAKREIEEETGLTDLTFVRELGKYQRYKIAIDGGEDESKLKKISLFLYTTKQTELKPVDPVHPQAIWLPIDQVAAKLTHKRDKSYFEHLRNSGALNLE